MMKNYGKELILDLHGCNSDKFTRVLIKKFFKELCKEIDMTPCKMVFWDYKGYPEEYAKAADHLKGTSAIQFISTSNITIHTLDVLERVYLNVFSCKDFKAYKAASFCVRYFEGEIVNMNIIERK